MNEHVLVLCLHHVVPLGAHQSHVAINVHRLLVLDPLQHGVDHDEAAGPTHAGAVKREKILTVNFLRMTSRIFPRTTDLNKTCVTSQLGEKERKCFGFEHDNVRDV